MNRLGELAEVGPLLNTNLPQLAWHWPGQNDLCSFESDISETSDISCLALRFDDSMCGAKLMIRCTF